MYINEGHGPNVFPINRIGVLVLVMNEPIDNKCEFIIVETEQPTI